MAFATIAKHSAGTTPKASFGQSNSPAGNLNKEENLSNASVNIPAQFVTYQGGKAVETDTAVATTVVDNVKREIYTIVDAKVPEMPDEYIVVIGYYAAEYDVFFKEPEFINPIVAKKNKIYLDAASNIWYLYNPGISAGQKHFTSCLALADETKPGLTKLYAGLGTNTDGTVTQSEITEQINSITFSIAPDDDECLVLSKKV